MPEAAAVPPAGDTRARIVTAPAGFAADLRFADIPAAVRHRAKHLMLDAVGIAFASGQEDFAKRTLKGLQTLSDQGRVPAIGLDQALSARDAAIVNGVLCHGLDFDDTHLAGIVHATAFAFPAAFSAGTLAGASGRDLLTAYVIGVEVGSRLGAVARGGFHQVGFHPTAVCGTFACALAAGRLMGLDAKALASAQGIALSQAAGSFEFLADGAWTKRLHPGWAAASGMTAAALAKAGFKGAADPYAGRVGLYRSYLGPLEAECNYDLATAGLGEVFEVMNVALKPYPACHFTHGCLDAARALRGLEGFDAAAIERVTALVPAKVVSTVCEPIAAKRRPQNAYDAQFSLFYQVAAVLLRGQFTLDELEGDALAHPAIRELAARVHYAEDPKTTFPRHYSGELVVELKDGRTLRRREPINRGAPDRPLDDEEIVQKFMANATRSIDRARAEAVGEAILSIDARADLDDLAARLA